MTTPVAVVDAALGDYLTDVSAGATTPTATARKSGRTPKATGAKATTVAAAAAASSVPSLPKVGPTRRKNGVMYVPRELAGLEDLAVLRRLRETKMFPLLSGPPGAGKTAMVEAAFPDLITIVCSGDTEVADFVGQWVQSPSGDYEWVDGPLVVACEEGRCLLVDELALCSPSVLSVLYPLMDGRGEITIGANPKRGTVKAAEGFSVVGAYNPNVPGSRGVSEALLSRFTLSFEVTTDWTLAKALKVPAEAVKVARNLEKKAAEAGDIEWVPQLRELLAFRDLADVLGMDAAWANLLAIAPEHDRDIVKSVVDSVRGQATTALALGAQI